MRKKRSWYRCIIMCVVVVFSILFSAEQGMAATSLKLVYDGKKVNYTRTQVKFTVQGKQIDLHNTPGIVINDTSLGYYADIFKTALHATCKYNKDTKKLTIKKFDRTVVLTLNSKTAYVNGKKKTMDVAMKKVKFVDEDVTRIMVPVRFVAENLGYTYNWNGSTKTGEITYSWLELYKDSVWSKYEGTKVKTTYNGKTISYGKMPGIIQEQTVLVNAKKIFASTLGGICTYNSSDKTITLKHGDTTIVYTIGSNVAVVNGAEKTMGTAALRVKNRENGTYYLMVPARFTATTLGYGYKWNSSIRTVQLTAKTSGGQDAIASGAAIYVTLPDGVENNAVKHADYYYKKKFTVTIPGDHVEYFDKTPLTICSDMVTKYEVALNSSGNTKITFSTAKLQGYKVHVDSNLLWIEVGNPKDIYKNIVVLDCGHGGSDPGAQGGGYNEKDLTYSILYTYAKKYFNSSTSEVKAYWSRYNDTFVTLSDRAAYAGSVGADLFVSLHMNSAANKTAKGTEVYYSTSNNNALKNGLTSQKMATAFQTNLVSALGSVNRGVKSAEFAVIKRNTVPAVLIELGFISNSSERAKLIDATYQKKAAKTIYDVVDNIFETYPTGR